MILKKLFEKEKELWKKENDSTGIIANKKPTLKLSQVRHKGWNGFHEL